MEKKYHQFVEFGHTRDDFIHKSNTWYDIVLEESISTNLVETKKICFPHYCFKLLNPSICIGSLFKSHKV
jgi:hypothetical protein